MERFQLHVVVIRLDKASYGNYEIDSHDNRRNLLNSKQEFSAILVYARMIEPCFWELMSLPDWSYHPLFKPWLSRLPREMGREFIHRGMSLISSLPGGRSFIEFLGHMNPSPQLERDIFGLTITNPVGLSGKIDPLLTGTKAFGNLGFGFIEIGPVTLNPSPASSTATFSKEQEQIIFPSCLESIGLAQTVAKLRAVQPAQKPLFIRIGKSENDEDTLAIIQSLLPYGDAFIIEEGFNENVCLEVKRILREKALLHSIHLEQINQKITLIKDLTNKQLIDGIVIEEQAIKQEKQQYYPAQQASELQAALQGLKDHGLEKIPKIISGGILEPQDALDMFAHGADLVMLSSGYVLSGPGLPKRINEGLIDIDRSKPVEDNGWKWYWLFGFMMLISGFIAIVFSMTRVILPYDEEFMQLTREQLIALNPNIIKFMAHDRMTLAGTMVSGGILYMQLARHGVRYGIHWARKAINIAGWIGFLGILLFLGYGYFDWLHGLLWLILFPFFYIGWRKTRHARETSPSRNRKNHPAWKRALWGQLSFIVLGFSFVLGGIVISSIGATSVFVPTDIGYICMTPEQLNEITHQLIPVIAHDRAGFGSALASVGLLVLMLSLWGFHQGEKWVWRTFLIGGIPAFSAGILTHFMIGYTTFIHLLPPYFALFLFIVGLILSKRFLYETREI